MAASRLPSLGRSRPFRHLLFLLLGLFATVQAHAQANNIYVYGTVKDYTSSKKLDGITVTVFKNGAKSNQTVTSANGKYEFNLDYGNEYKLLFAKPGMVSKNVSIDTRNIPDEERMGGLAMNMEMTLFSDLPGVDFKLLDQPIGKSKYDPALNMLTWDMAYTQQIQAAVDQLMAEYDKGQKKAASAEQEYAKLMAEGTDAMTKADYKKAVDRFTGALVAKAGDPIATAKLSDAQIKLKELEKTLKKDEQYAAFIKEADALFAKKSYEDAKVKYASAAEVKDAEPYPKQRIKECDAFMADMALRAEQEKKEQALTAQYQALVAAGDAAFKAQQFDEARTKFTEAKKMKPAEKYPPEQLAAITKALADLANKEALEKKAKEQEAAYQAVIASADAAFQKADYDAAKAKYNEALSIRPKDKYPTDQLAAIAGKIADLAKAAEEEKRLKAVDEQFNVLIAAGDASFKIADYEAAKGKYKEALVLKAKEKYPTDQLAAIDKKLADLALKTEADKAAKALEANYQATITAADAAFKKGDYQPAKGKYEEASSLKQAEKYPKDQIAAIDVLLAEAAKNAKAESEAKERDARFKEVMAQAEALYGKDKLEEARSTFQEALTVKSDEPRPKERIVEIDAKLADRARSAEAQREQEERDAKYKAMIADADGLFDSKKYPEALNTYKTASAMKETEKYPKDRIEEINALLTADAKALAEKERLEQEKQEQYKANIAAADKAFAAKQYAEASAGYNSALDLKPGEPYPTERLAAIQAINDSIAAQQDAALQAERDAQARYDQIIAKADAAFDHQEFDAARESYAEALGMRSQEKYPQERIDEIAKIQADRLQAEADSLLMADKRRLEEEDKARRSAADAEAARVADELRQKREGEKALDEQYAKVILDADGRLASQDLDGARDLYTQALDIKPKEAYPQVKIEQIDKLKQAQRDREEQARLLAEQQANVPPPEDREIVVDHRKEQEAEEFMHEAREREEAEKYGRIKRIKSNVVKQTEDHAALAADRHERSLGEKEGYEAAKQALLDRGEAERLKNEEELAAFRKALEAKHAQLEEKARSDQQAAVDAQKELEAQTASDRSVRIERHDAQVEAVEQRKTDLDRQQEELAASGVDRSRKAKEVADENVRQQAVMQQRGDAAVQRGREELDLWKQQQAVREEQVAAAAENRQNMERERLEAMPVNRARTAAEYSPNPLAQEYPQGVSEVSYTEGNKVIIKRVVVRGNKADEYSKVIAKWGTFYFKNGQSITEQIWTLNTEQ